MKKIISFIMSGLLMLYVSVNAKENGAGSGQLDWRELAKDIKNYSYGESSPEYEPIIFSVDEFESVKKTNKMYDRNTYISLLTEISSSSSMTENGVEYSAQKAVDGDLKTFWCEGKKDFGFREWIKVKLEIPKELKGKKEFASELAIFPGNGFSEKNFYENNRIKTAWMISRIKKPIPWIEISHLNFRDIYGYSTFSIANPYFFGTDCEHILYIESVYPGSKYNDTCISEIVFRISLIPVRPGMHNIEAP